ncbi:MAG: transporter [Rhizobium sp.]|nr:transporter [Rhizobium sp.]
MSATTLQPARVEFSPLVIALAGALTLSAAMGIGRFAFTPLMPMMLDDGVIDINGGSLLATANYIGYLLGALLCMALPALLRRVGIHTVRNAAMVRFGLVATVVLTIAMALHLPWAWPALRLLSGIISAVVFVYMSGWCLKRLAEMNALSLSGIIYTGPGIGITLSGAVAYGMSSAGGSSGMAWIAFGVLAALLAATVWAVFRPDAVTRSRGPEVRTAASAALSQDCWTMEQMILALAYGLAGFGYIITATFLPVIAKEALGESGWIELFWPIFGIGVASGALLTRIIPLAIDRRALLIACYIVQAIGVVIALLLPTVAGFMIGSTLVGLPFTVITLFGMQEARRLRPVDATSFIALMTATYGTGQIAGPPLAAAILANSASHAVGFSVSLIVASGALLFGAALYALAMWRYPLGK